MSKKKNPLYLPLLAKTAAGHAVSSHVVAAASNTWLLIALGGAALYFLLRKKKPERCQLVIKLAPGSVLEKNGVATTITSDTTLPETIVTLQT